MAKDVVTLSTIAEFIKEFSKKSGAKAGARIERRFIVTPVTVYSHKCGMCGFEFITDDPIDDAICFRCGCS